MIAWLFFDAGKEAFAVLCQNRLCRFVHSRNADLVRENITDVSDLFFGCNEIESERRARTDEIRAFSLFVNVMSTLEILLKV